MRTDVAAVGVGLCGCADGGMREELKPNRPIGRERGSRVKHNYLGCRLVTLKAVQVSVALRIMFYLWTIY